MGRAVTDYGFTALGLQTIVGFTRPTNFASRRVLVKLGFVFERTVTADGKDSVLYRLASSSPRP
jgi:RimJ/RimL family protein N-acetyltransferase